ncbi:MAG: S26 family signal peptidase [Chitinivibrionales bacterium]
MVHYTDGAKAPKDLRITIYRVVKYLVIIVALTLAVKYLLLDSVRIQTDQMSPALLDGDRVCLLRVPFFWPFTRMIVPARRAPVIFEHPLFPKSLECLRVAGLPGDSMVISGGRFLVMNKPGTTLGTLLASEDVLPIDFAPRDSMEPYRLPRRGDTIDLDSLSLRDFFYACAMIQQENPGAACHVRADLFIDGKPSNDFKITSFPLYNGALEAIPKKFEYDWFFWGRLKEYFSHALNGKDIALTLSLSKNGVRIFRYCLKENFVFVLADDWCKGFDSRYFGPVRAASIKGRVVCVLWSMRHPEKGIGFLRMDRLIKIIR